RRTVEELAKGAHEERRLLAHAEHGDAARIVDVLVEGGLHAAGLERAHERLGIGAAAKDLELHEEPTLGGLLVGAALPDVHLRRLVAAHAQPPRVCISRCGSRLRPPICTSGW